MKTERELFEEAFKKVNSGVSFWLNTWSDEDNDYGHLTASWGWHMWQASANREGYKLVPAEATDSQWAAGIDAYTQAMHGQDILSASAFFDIYKAMIGAIE